MRLWYKRLAWAVVAMAIVGAIIYFMMPRPVYVDLAEVSRGALLVTVDEDGKTRIKERYVVSSPLAGRLQRIDLEPGDSVVTGNTVLAVIEPTDPNLLDPRARAEAEARVKAAEATLKQATPNLERALTEMNFAESEVGRVRTLFNSNAATRQELEDKERTFHTRAQEYRAANFAKEIATYELELAQAALLRTQPDSDGSKEEWRFEIHTPISGRVLRVIQKSATVVTAGTQLMEVGNPDDLEVEIDVLSKDAVRIKPGARVILVEWGGDAPLDGTVRLVEPSGFTKVSALGVEEQRVNAIIDFTGPADARQGIGDEFRVEARIIVWEGSDVLKVPRSALFRYQDGWAAFRAVDNVARLAPVQVGHSNQLEAEILGGVEAGDRVVVHPGELKEGVRIVERQ